MTSFFFKIFERGVKFLGLEKLVFRASQKYVFDAKGENNSDILTNGEWHFIRRNIGKFHTVFDVGANRGDWTRLVFEAASARNIASPNIHAFEPVRSTFALLERAAFPANVHLCNMGLGNEARERSMHIIEEGSGGNSFYARDVEGFRVKNVEQVRVETVDGYCRKNHIQKIDFMKVDVEGHEMEVLKGARSMLGRGAIDAVQFEYGGTWIDARMYLKDLFAFFEEFPEYKIYKLFPGEARPIPRYDQQLDDFQYANFLAIKNNGMR